MLHRIYLLGYSGKTLPKWLRRLCAGSAWHRAYIAGRLFVHIDNGIRRTRHTMPAEQLSM